MLLAVTNNLGHYHQPPIHPELNHPAQSSLASHGETGNHEWSRILWSMAKTGFVPFRRSNIDQLDEEKPPGFLNYNSGGLAQARRPGTSQANKTKKKKPNRKPIEDDDDDDEGHYVKRKQGSGGLPWLFNLMGPPGKKM